jgi:hypothetical protein
MKAQGANNADAPNAAVTLRFHSDHYGRGVGDLRRSPSSRASHHAH